MAAVITDFRSAVARRGQVIAIGLSAALAGMAISGCSSGLGTAGAALAPSGPGAASGIHGSIYGGQQPVVGASIQLYAVGTTGLKSASTALIATPPTSDSNGNFSIGTSSATALYSCTGATQVYLTATGGSSSGGSPNTAIALMAPLGDCATLKANAATTYVQINEVTTIAAAFALAQFSADLTHVGAAGSNPTGLLNAVATFNNLVSLGTGAAGGASLPSGATVPVAKLYTLANIIAACVNTATSGSSSCNTLLTATGATDTIGASFAIAKNPAAPAILALYPLAASVPPFQPSLPSAPTDWTIAIQYNASGQFSAPYGIAIDSAGNAWVTNSTGKAIDELSPNGTLLSMFTTSGLVGAKGVAIDRTGNVWIANTPANSVIELNGSGGLVSPAAGYTGGGLNGPVSIAMDSAGNAWVANLAGNSVTELNNSGTPTAANGSTGFTAGGTLSGPSGVAIDPTGNVVIANSGAGNVVKLTNAGGVATGSPFTDVALQGTTSVAVDTSGNIWATGSTTGSAVAGAVSQFSNAGAAVSYSPLSNGGLSVPVGVATAGTSAFVTNRVGGSLSQLTLSSSTPASPASGYGSLNTPVGVAVDGSGNVWTANSGDNTVSVFVGLATPVTTPLSANVGP